MQNVADRCNLGLALQETIEQLKLSKEKDIIMNTYRDVFKKRYQEFHQKFSMTASAKADFLVENQYPIDSYSRQEKNNEKQYYRAILCKPSFTYHKVNEMLKGKDFALVEGYSTNEDPKRKNMNKSRNHRDKGATPHKQRKRN